MSLSKSEESKQNTINLIDEVNQYFRNHINGKQLSLLNNEEIKTFNKLLGKNFNNYSKYCRKKFNDEITHDTNKFINSFILYLKLNPNEAIGYLKKIPYNKSIPLLFFDFNTHFSISRLLINLITPKKMLYNCKVIHFEEKNESAALICKFFFEEILFTCFKNNNDHELIDLISKIMAENKTYTKYLGNKSGLHKILEHENILIQFAKQNLTYFFDSIFGLFDKFESEEHQKIYNEKVLIPFMELLIKIQNNEEGFRSTILYNILKFSSNEFMQKFLLAVPVTYWTYDTCHNCVKQSIVMLKQEHEEKVNLSNKRKLDDSDIICTNGDSNKRRKITNSLKEADINLP